MEAEQRDPQSLAVFYFDQASVQSCPCVPYRWQPRGQTWRLPAHDVKRLAIMGFFSRDHRHDLHLLEERVNSRTVIDLIDGFIQRRAHPQRFTLIVLDNASIHTSVLFNAQLERWLRQRVIIYWLPTYSPELNRIEILWRKIKYEGLPLSAFGSIQTIKTALCDIINNLGLKYRINFG